MRLYGVQAVNDTQPNVSGDSTDLRELGIVEVSYFWKGQTVRQFLAPDDVITRAKRIEGRNRALVAAYLVWRDGNRCYFRSPVCVMGDAPFRRPESADFDHEDGDRLNHRPRNLRLACNPCNSYMERQRHLQWKRPHRTLPPAVREKPAVEITSDTVAINIDVFPVYQKWLGDNCPMSVKEAIHGSVLYLREKTGHGSSESNRRYLNDLTTGKDSPFVVEENRVRKR